ncbi:MAG: fumarylacetoacetate hydrolase family protein [Synergistaceae bacterium]|jgi:2-keto-4-pentenoate hydratase/2-oxohepta-3-ene-1,7-dioic acid hydratase in catechol pathway|nr:fumarylacetoacetate hydrolase family protein [Synergistaceae bacterium]
MTDDVWTNIEKLEEGTVILRVTVEGRTSWGRKAGEKVELLDADLRPTGRKCEEGEFSYRTPIDPVKIWCIGLNYREHAKESHMEVPEEPCVFMKPRTCVVAHKEPVKLPAWVGRVDYEGELAVVIGKACRNVSEDKALDCVLGYTCFNDVSARVLQKKDGQWIRSKGFDTFGPLGPGLLVAKSLPETPELMTRLNGAVVQRSRFGDMIFSVSAIISHLSRFATLEAGDVIATGTPNGVGPVQPGDTVEISIDGVGTLENLFIADGAAESTAK